MFVLFISLIILPGTAAASSWELIPENPAVGDMIERRGANFTGEKAENLSSDIAPIVSVTFVLLILLFSRIKKC